MASPSSRPIPNGVRRLVRARSHGDCEMCGQRDPLQLHHRKQRSVGGAHLVSNLLHLCNRCHVQVHQRMEHSLQTGRIIHSWASSLTSPVLLTRGWVYLDEDGSWRASDMSRYERLSDGRPAEEA